MDPDPGSEQIAPSRNPVSRTAEYLAVLARRAYVEMTRSDTFVVTTLALIVGMLAGVGSFLFHLLLEGTGDLLHTATGGWGAWPSLVLLPVIGVLAALGLIRLFARHDHSHGTSAVIESVAFHAGRLAAWPMLTKVVAAAVFIGSGGSAGPEDPSVQLGGVAGSVVGGALRLSARRRRTLVASGVAGAVAAAFNAPIAGVFFAFEVVVGEMNAALFPPVVLASVAASAMSRWLMGNTPAFQIPSYGLASAAAELPMYAVLGICTAVIGVAFKRLIFSFEDAMTRFRIPRIGAGVAAALTVGAVGLWLPEILGVGYSTVGSVIGGEVTDPVHLMLLLAAKLVLTAMCISAAGIGGTFAPSLYLGAMTGALIGLVAHTLFNETPAAAYALVGMGGVLSATVRAPITSVLLLFEITNDYRIILPIMLCVAVSNSIARWLSPESVYTERLARNGIRLRDGFDQNLMERITVADAMTTEFEAVAAEAGIRTALDILQRRLLHGLPVLRDDRLVGIVTEGDIATAMENGIPEDIPVLMIATTNMLTAFSDQTLHDVIPLFAMRDVRQIPVVKRDNPTHLIGMLRRADIMRSYNLRIVRRMEQDTPVG
ncbi:MAG: chloride channel protein [Bacteroidetes bacterium]|nr:chloride channel protein [Bacteroidota bacterium]